MAKIVLIGLEQAAAVQICQALAAERHRIEQQPPDVPIRVLADVDIVFAGGEPNRYIPLLARVREARPALPFVVVSRTAETKEWLDAIEAGATDYCSVPIERRQLHWLMESTRPWPRITPA
jgi:DNA-binding NtrC family response regulator